MEGENKLEKLSVNTEAQISRMFRDLAKPYWFIEKASSWQRKPDFGDQVLHVSKVTEKESQKPVLSFHLFLLIVRVVL